MFTFYKYKLIKSLLMTTDLLNCDWCNSIISGKRRYGPKHVSFAEQTKLEFLRYAQEHVDLCNSCHLSYYAYRNDDYEDVNKNSRYYKYYLSKKNSDDSHSSLSSSSDIDNSEYEINETFKKAVHAKTREEQDDMLIRALTISIKRQQEKLRRQQNKFSCWC